MSELELVQLVVLWGFFTKNMTIFLNFYIITYLLTLVQINYLLSNYIFNNNSNFSLNYMIIYILKFNKLKNIIFVLILSLAGLPPFIMFFIKFNFLINTLYKTNIFIIITIFIVFFLNMIFYIQVFFHKNSQISLNYKKNKKKKLLNYSIVYVITFFILFNMLSILFFSDFYFILKLVISGNI